MGDPYSLSMDSNNNLFLEEETKGAMEASVGDVAGYEGLTPTINVWYLQDYYAPFFGAATGMGVNSNDELFTAYSYSTTLCDIVAESAYAAGGTSTPSYPAQPAERNAATLVMVVRRLAPKSAPA
jgi:hypothetical protein